MACHGASAWHWPELQANVDVVHLDFPQCQGHVLRDSPSAVSFPVGAAAASPEGVEVVVAFVAAVVAAPGGPGSVQMLARSVSTCSVNSTRRSIFRTG